MDTSVQCLPQRILVHYQFQIVNSLSDASSDLIVLDSRDIAVTDTVSRIERL